VARGEGTGLRRALHARALLAQLATFFPLSRLQLMTIGRGWWTWNSQQVSGPFTCVLPLDSYLMYLTGSLMPVLVFVGLEGVFDRPEEREVVDGSPAVVLGFASSIR